MEILITTDNVTAAADALRAAKPGFVPEVAVVLGSGLNGLAASIEDATVVPYEDVPGMPSSTMHLHVGQFVMGTLNGVDVVCMQGRVHAYEGYTAHQIAFPIHVMNALGAGKLVVTNAAGGINPAFGVGDLMLITDHINFQMMNPVIGAAVDAPLFFDMTHAYAPRLRQLAREAAAECGIQLQEGVYIADQGPSFETPAEVRAFGIWGADAVGMSTVQEVIAANQLGMEVLGISLISNPAAGVCDEPLSMEDVTIAAEQAAEDMGKLVSTVLPRL